MQRLLNRKILVTGAASGIGRAAAERLASEGAHLALMDIQAEPLEELARQLQAAGTRVVYTTCDVRDFWRVGECIDELSEQLGGLQALSHNAGILRCYNSHEMTPEQWEEIIGVNLTGTFNVNRHALKHLLKYPVSFLVNTSSIAAYYRHPWLAAYSASKGAIQSWTRSLVIEYFAQGLRANCVMPGSIDTPLSRSFEVPHGADPELLRYLDPLGHANLVSAQSIAAAIAYLTSDDALHINGTEICIDGGKV